MAKETIKAGYIVISSFRDKADFGKEYKEGDDLSELPGITQERLDELVEKQLVSSPVKVEKAPEQTAEEIKAEKDRKAAEKKQQDDAVKLQKEADKAAADAAKKLAKEQADAEKAKADADLKKSQDSQ